VSENEKSVKKPLNKKIVIIIACAVVVALLVALIPIIITLTADKPHPEDTPDTGETFEGVYTLSMLSMGAPGKSSYHFKEGNKVTNTYKIGTADEVTVEYSYRIAIIGGKKYIVLSDASNSEQTLDFSYGTETVKYDVCKSCSYEGVSNELTVCDECETGEIELVTRTRTFVRINEGTYYKESDSSEN
jgi:hypothetical protein